MYNHQITSNMHNHTSLLTGQLVMIAYLTANRWIPHSIPAACHDTLMLMSDSCMVLCDNASCLSFHVGSYVYMDKALTCAKVSSNSVIHPSVNVPSKTGGQLLFFEVMHVQDGAMVERIHYCS